MKKSVRLDKDYQELDNHGPWYEIICKGRTGYSATCSNDYIKII